MHSCGLSACPPVLPSKPVAGFSPVGWEFASCKYPAGRSTGLRLLLLGNVPEGCTVLMRHQRSCMGFLSEGKHGFHWSNSHLKPELLGVSWDTFLALIRLPGSFLILLGVTRAGERLSPQGKVPHLSPEKHARTPVILRAGEALGRIVGFWGLSASPRDMGWSGLQSGDERSTGIQVGRGLIHCCPGLSSNCRLSPVLRLVSLLSSA